MALFSSALGELDAWRRRAGDSGCAVEPRGWPAGRTMLLRQDTGLELGAPGDESRLLLGWSSEPLPGAGVHLIGPDLPALVATGQGRAPLGLAVLAGGELADRYASYTALRDALLGLELAGVMIRHLPAQQGVWLRLGRDALERGLDAAALGGGIARAVGDLPGVGEVSVTLVTGPVAEVAALAPAARQAAEITEALFRMEHDDLEMECDTCDLSDLCDSVAELREAHQRLTR